MKILTYLLCALSLVLLVSCEDPNDPVIVSVGKTKLKLSDAKSMAPEWDTWSDHERLLFLEHWIDEEVIYQEAVDNHALEDTSLIKLIEMTTRKVVVDYYMQSYLDTMVVGDAEKIDFYHKNHDLYVNGKYRITGAIMTFPDWKSASIFYKDNKSKRFDAVPIYNHLIKKVFPFESVEENPDSCLISSVRDISIGRITAMKVCDGEAKIALVTSRLDSTDLKPFEEVAEDVATRTWIEHQKVVVDRLKSQWKTKRLVFQKANVFTEKDK